MSEERPGFTVDMRPDPDYWQALGEFVESFADTEIALFYHLVRAAKIEEDVARALFGGERAANYVNLITRIWEVRPPTDEIRQELEPVFQWFFAINDTRNIIIHYRSWGQYSTLTTSEGVPLVTSDGRPLRVSDSKIRISSDIVRARDRENPRVKHVSAQIVRDMTADLLRIRQHLMSLFAYPNAPLSVRAAKFPEILNAWRYTPEPSRPQKPQTPSKKKKRRPK
jgi:hypothetical protein